MKKPPCFDNVQQLDDWLHYDWIAHSNATVKGERSESGYCRDCTPEFAAQMRKCGKCIQPQVIFDRTAEGELVGIGFSMERAE